MAEPQGLLQRVVLVTGPSGAGRSSAVNALEDFGFEVIDNIPISLVPRLFESPINRPLAIGVDARNRDYSADGILDLYRRLSRRPDLEVSLLYLDCSAEVLTRRYSETRRRHPMAPDESPIDGIDRELRMLDDVRACADILINTTELTVHELRASMAHWFGQTAGQGLAVSLHSFSFKRGMPQGLDMAFDCRFLRNPHWVADLRPLTGIDCKVAAHVKSDPRFDEFFQHVKSLLCFQLPAVVEEGKTHFSAGFGCTGGKHRSVMMVEMIASALEDENWPVSVRHKELERMGMWSVSSGLTAKSGLAGGVS